MMQLDEITIDDFRRAKFKGDRSVIKTDDDLSEVEVVYYDIAGLFETEDFNRVSHINYLSTRNNSVEFFCKLQIEFLIEFSVPYISGFEFIKKFGYNLKWEKDHLDFLSQIEKIRKREKKFIDQLEGAINELEEYRSKNKKEDGVKKEVTIGSFLNTLFSLRKCGFQFDNKSTSMEELAYMIKYQIDKNKAEEAKIKSLRHK